jgi:hypothetical protein
MPKRIQRSRAKDWRMPEGAVYVGRPSKWGNLFPVEDGFYAEAVEKFEQYMIALKNNSPVDYEQIISGLRGKDLACWCPLDCPCHADVLLRLANT